MLWSKEDMKKIDACMKKLEESPSIQLVCNRCKKIQSLEPIVFKESKLTLQDHINSKVCEYCDTKGKIVRAMKG